MITGPEHPCCCRQFSGSKWSARFLRCAAMCRQCSDSPLPALSLDTFRGRGEKNAAGSNGRAPPRTGKCATLDGPSITAMVVGCVTSTPIRQR